MVIAERLEAAHDIYRPRRGSVQYIFDPGSSCSEDRRIQPIDSARPSGARIG
jgi:hypothetical protein